LIKTLTGLVGENVPDILRHCISHGTLKSSALLCAQNPKGIRLDSLLKWVGDESEK
jgi:hypothetical protein